MLDSGRKSTIWRMCNGNSNNWNRSINSNVVQMWRESSGILFDCENKNSNNTLNEQERMIPEEE